MPGGGPPWSQRGTKGGGQTIAVNNRPKIVRKDLTQTTTLASGASETVELYAPSGSVYKIRALAITCDVPGTATDGTHYFQIRSLGNVAVLLGRSDYTSHLMWNNGHWFTANVRQEPNTEAAAIESIHGTMATADNPIRIEYWNNLDVDQTNERSIEFLIEEVSY
jgi:hypothetical protein